MAKKSVTRNSRNASDNRPMTTGEIATAVAKKQAGGAIKKTRSQSRPENNLNLPCIVRIGDEFSLKLNI
jgi:hypothetical protein